MEYKQRREGREAIQPVQVVCHERIITYVIENSLRYSTVVTGAPAAGIIRSIGVKPLLP